MASADSRKTGHQNRRGQRPRDSHLKEYEKIQSAHDALFPFEDDNVLPPRPPFLARPRAAVSTPTAVASACSPAALTSTGGHAVPADSEDRTPDNKRGLAASTTAQLVVLSLTLLVSSGVLYKTLHRKNKWRVSKQVKKRQNVVKTIQQAQEAANVAPDPSRASAWAVTALAQQASQAIALIVASLLAKASNQPVSSKSQPAPASPAPTTTTERRSTSPSPSSNGSAKGKAKAKKQRLSLGLLNVPPSSSAGSSAPSSPSPSRQGSRTPSTPVTRGRPLPRATSEMAVQTQTTDATSSTSQPVDRAPVRRTSPAMKSSAVQTSPEIAPRMLPFDLHASFQASPTTGSPITKLSPPSSPSTGSSPSVANATLRSRKAARKASAQAALAAHNTSIVGLTRPGSTTGRRSISSATSASSSPARPDVELPDPELRSESMSRGSSRRGSEMSESGFFDDAGRQRQASSNSWLSEGPLSMSASSRRPSSELGLLTNVALSPIDVRPQRFVTEPESSHDHGGLHEATPDRLRHVSSGGGRLDSRTNSPVPSAVHFQRPPSFSSPSTSHFSHVSNHNASSAPSMMTSPIMEAPHQQSVQTPPVAYLHPNGLLNSQQWSLAQAQLQYQQALAMQYQLFQSQAQSQQSPQLRRDAQSAPLRVSTATGAATSFGTAWPHVHPSILSPPASTSAFQTAMYSPLTSVDPRYAAYAAPNGTSSENQHPTRRTDSYQSPQTSTQQRRPSYGLSARGVSGRNKGGQGQADSRKTSWTGPTPSGDLEVDRERLSKELEIARWKLTVLEDERVQNEIENQEALNVLARRAQRAEARLKAVEDAQRTAISDAASSSPASSTAPSQTGHETSPTTTAPDEELTEEPEEKPHPLAYVDLDTVNFGSPAPSIPRAAQNGGRSNRKGRRSNDGSTTHSNGGYTSGSSRRRPNRGRSSMPASLSPNTAVSGRTRNDTDNGSSRDEGDDEDDVLIILDSSPARATSSTVSIARSVASSRSRRGSHASEAGSISATGENRDGPEIAVGTEEEEEDEMTSNPSSIDEGSSSLIMTTSGIDAGESESERAAPISTRIESGTLPKVKVDDGTLLAANESSEDALPAQGDARVEST